MRHAIEQAGAGVARITLYESDMGAPLYRAMGFEPGAALMLLMPTAVDASGCASRAGYGVS